MQVLYGNYYSSLGKCKLKPEDIPLYTLRINNYNNSS